MAGVHSNWLSPLHANELVIVNSGSSECLRKNIGGVVRNVQGCRVFPDGFCLLQSAVGPELERCVVVLVGWLAFVYTAGANAGPVATRSIVTT
jgi:hypothetical protein